ncbi:MULTISPECIES: CDP-diacylglycerol--serine O-phosphatidyltransferase [Reichenbachiella]|uniref:CDP-diacylglycerol--serine O-phosphatidyltransferase n=1 Tax=Reichenbachiella TaxID=156993 RepID=UPI000E6D23B2|nr:MULTISPECIES: CDP-diacylglycerol--serine O-phosphatidyltransferase [Reichenbachiella]MBU2915540.1 CDP-diacylglycerol--serine O-phosphatidyltransferase [Reichenbachiella agariperforans]RJE71396.1 CDP-diacylglycerol--serine O-phosphatidyltransferase [Reichenbachiella sp. MSK19-1]
MRLRNFVPNFLTCLNLIFGCLALIEIFDGHYDRAIYYVFLSGVADFFDGFAARLLKATSNIGKDLDSLADMVSFGVVPAFVMFKMIEENAEQDYLPYVALIIVAFSALRLAKFNNDERQSDSFHGLPVPANALFLCALPFLASAEVFQSTLSNPWVLVVISIVMASLLVTDVKLLALKFKHFGWKGNEARYLILGLSLVGLATFQVMALPFVIVFYFIGSIFVNAAAPEGH